MAYAKMTKKAVMDFFPTTICIYYCEAQHLLSGLDPNASVYGNMGKNADVYCIGSTVAIVTGARAFGNFRPDYKTVHQFEERAEDICRKYAWSGERDVELRKLREEFIQATVYDRSTHTYKTVAGEKAEIECISGAWYVFTRRDDEDDTVLCAECDSFAEAEIELHRIRPKAKKIA